MAVRGGGPTGLSAAGCFRRRLFPTTGAPQPMRRVRLGRRGWGDGAMFESLAQVGQEGQQERLCFAGASARGDDDIFPLDAQAEGIELVLVELNLWRE